MKISRNLSIIFILFFNAYCFAQPTQLTWEFKNVSIISPGSGALDSLRFEVWVSADATGSYFGQSAVAIEYPYTVFGSNIWSNTIGQSNLRFERGSLLLESFGGNMKYNIMGIANTFPQVFSVLVQPALVPFNELYYTMVPTTPNQFMIFTVAIQDTCGTGQMIFNADLMNGSQECVPDCSFADFSIYDQGDMITFPLESCTVGTMENKIKDIQIWSINNIVYVNAPNISNGEIIVLDMMGKEVARKQTSQGLNSIQLNTANSYYIVKVISDETLKTRKVFIR
ncbi:MAG: T9SS type A sorting domain-containing protein [Chlorobi bacterium]|nr:T9SS type A sorting domain-containing protein [Chlorobiota bacterium]